MALSTALTSKPESGTPYQLDISQTLRASAALANHIRSEGKRRRAESGKQNLLANEDGSDVEGGGEEDVPIWLSVTTKKHIVDKKRLKPSKIPLPHSLHAPSDNTSSSSTICLITADPQRTYKDLIAEPSFPLSLSSRINRVIGITKLKARYKSYESRRQLLAESDIFLADNRIITYLPQVLGKVFYHGGAKRPIPVSIAAKPAKDKDGKKVKNTKSDGEGGGRGAARPADVAKEIERTINTALVHLSPSTNTSIKIGKASFTAEQIAANVQAVVQGLVDKFIPKGWRNIRAIHIKGPNTMALPIWLADELWVDEKDVREPKPVKSAEEMKAIQEKPKEKKERKEKKRKRNVWDTFEEEETTNPPKKTNAEREQEKAEAVKKEMALRKEVLRKQKQEAIASADEDGVRKPKKQRASVAA